MVRIIFGILERNTMNLYDVGDMWKCDPFFDVHMRDVTYSLIETRFHRSLTRPFFTRERISHFELFDRRAQQAISKLNERLREGYAVDFQVPLPIHDFTCPDFWTECTFAGFDVPFYP
jgi:hypothetical protein